MMETVMSVVSEDCGQAGRSWVIVWVITTVYAAAATAVAAIFAVLWCV